jgi:hypothetical protein
MKKINIYYLTGILGIFFFVFEMTVIPLYFIYSGAPPLINILTRTLIEILGCISLLLFFCTLRSAVIKRNTELEWIATIILVFGMSYGLMALIVNSIQVGSVWAHNFPTDPTVVGNGGEGAILMFGPIGRLFSAILLFLTARVLKAVNIIPTWAQWLGYFIGFFQLAFIPTLFNLTSPNDFYSVNGWGIPVAGSTFLFWILLISVFFILNRKNSDLDNLDTPGNAYLKV